MTGRSDEGDTSRDELLRLSEIQRFIATAVMREPTSELKMQEVWIDGRSMSEVAAEFVLPSSSLTAAQRLEVYNQQFWIRVLDSMEEDFPGIVAVLGSELFERLSRKYLLEHRSRSFTLRDLGSEFPEFIERNLYLVQPYPQLCLDLARFEWAHIVAFDGPSAKPITEEDLANGGMSLSVALQPYMTLLEIQYPLDDFTIALGKELRQRSEAGSTERSSSIVNDQKSVVLPERSDETICMAVHRHQSKVYFKRLERPSFILLKYLGSGMRLADACEATIELCVSNDQLVSDLESLSATIQSSFKTFMRLGWLCRTSN